MHYVQLHFAKGKKLRRTLNPRPQINEVASRKTKSTVRKRKERNPLKMGGKEKSSFLTAADV